MSYDENRISDLIDGGLEEQKNQYIKEKAELYARIVCGEYYSQLLNGCDETLGEIAIKDFTAGYNHAIDDLKLNNK